MSNSIHWPSDTWLPQAGYPAVVSFWAGKMARMLGNLGRFTALEILKRRRPKILEQAVIIFIMLELLLFVAVLVSGL